MRKGHMMTELPNVLLARADLELARRDWEEAMRLAEEALELARLRGMLPLHSDALNQRSKIGLGRIRSDVWADSTGVDIRLAMAQDDAQAALDMARACGYRWAERDALGLLSETSAALVNVKSAVDWRREASQLSRQLQLRGRAI